MEISGKFFTLVMVLAMTILVAGCTGPSHTVSESVNYGTGGNQGTGPSPAVTLTHPVANLTLTPSSPQASRQVDPLHPPIVRGSSFRYSKNFPTDPSVREVRLWLFTNDTCTVITPIVQGGKTMSEKNLMVVFDENMTLHLGSVSILL